MKKTRLLLIIVASALSAATLSYASKVKTPSTEVSGTTAPATTKQKKTEPTTYPPGATPEQMREIKKKEKTEAKPTGTGDTIPAGYPLKTCVVCGKPLKFGTLYTFTYHRDDKPDCTVVLHDKSCVKEFEKDPDNYIDKVQAAAAKNK